MRLPTCAYIALGLKRRTELRQRRFMKIRVVALSTPTLACARPATIQEEVHAAISSPFYAVSLAPSPS
jgi:hypothetical protein